MALSLACAFATSPDTPAHVAEAERLGYARAWLYDSPALYPDVWVTLALAAQATSTIGLGPGVLVPSLRHPMVNAAAIAQLAQLAPGRVAVGIGAGFTGRMTLGQRPLPWSYVRSYVATVQALLRGETAEWEGAPIRMLHPDGFAPERPVEVPFLLGADGPKGDEAARALGDGILTTQPRAGWEWCSVLTFATVLGDDEDPGSPRVLAAAGHAGSVALHAMVERGMPVGWLPGGQEWLEGLDEELVEAGATEVAYQPAGPDIPGELARFADVARSLG